MSETVALEIPNQADRQARAVAARTQRRLKDVLLEWINRAEAEPPMESLADDQVLALCDLQSHQLSQRLFAQSQGASLSRLIG